MTSEALLASVKETAPTIGAAALTKFQTRKDKALAAFVLSFEPSLLYLTGADQQVHLKYGGLEPITSKEVLG